MEFEEVPVKPDLGLCRCCHAEGVFKDLNEEYTWMDEIENYGEMLQKCFNIRIKQYPNHNGISGASKFICEDCTERLREANKFRKQVLANEKKLAEMLGHMETEDLEENKTLIIEIKAEPRDINIEEHGVASQSYTTSMDGGIEVCLKAEPYEHDGTPTHTGAKRSSRKSRLWLSARRKKRGGYRVKKETKESNKNLTSSTATATPSLNAEPEENANDNEESSASAKICVDASANLHDYIEK